MTWSFESAMAAPSSPQPQAVGETSSKINYASLLHANSSSHSITKTILNPIELVHGEPTIKFTMEEVAEFTREEGLHQAIVIKFSYGHPDLNDIRSLIPKQLGIKGNCLVGWLAHRHFLIRFDQFEDFVAALSTQVRYLKFKSEEFLYRVFSWSQWFNPKEETSVALTWISFPSLPPSMFARKALLSIASAVGKPLAIDKATQVRSRPSTARVKVLVDLLDKHPKRIKLCYLDEKTGKVLEQYQEVMYDDLPLYCMVCKHQGHEMNSCRHKSNSDVQVGVVQPSLEANNVEQLKGDARAFLNAKRVENQMAELSTTKELVSTNLNADKVMENATAEVHDNSTNLIDASNVDLGQQLPPQNRGATSDNYNLATAVALKSVDHTLSMVKEASIADSRQNIDVTRDGDVAENLESCKVNFIGHVNNEQGWLTIDNCTELQAENCSNKEDNKAENWTLVAHKNTAGSHKCSSTNRGISPSHEKGEIENLKLSTQNVFAPLSVTSKQQQDQSMDTSQRETPTPTHEFSNSSPTKEVDESRRQDENNQDVHRPSQPTSIKMREEQLGQVNNDIIQVINEVSSKSKTWAGQAEDEEYQNNGKDFFDDDEEDNMLDMCFDKVARDGDISPRQQRSGSIKMKKKTHGRQHSWDGKVIREFVPKHLPMRLAKQNHLTVSIASERFNKSKKK